MDIFALIAERKIQEAMREGMFEGLEGTGRPLAFEDETWIPEDLRAAYRVLKNAGCIPPELEDRKVIMNLRSLIDTIDDDGERLRKVKELNFRIMRFNMNRKTPMNVDGFPEYEQKIIKKLIP